MNLLGKTYEPKEFVERIYNNWIEKRFFEANADSDKAPFTIMMPPPNITGVLHMGHGMDNTLQDIIVRYKRMQGFETLWVPGIDTQVLQQRLKLLSKCVKKVFLKKI